MDPSFELPSDNARGAMSKICLVGEASDAQNWGFRSGTSLNMRQKKRVIKGYPCDDQKGHAHCMLLRSR